MAKVSMELLDSTDSIEKKILAELRKEVDKRLNKVLQSVVTPIRTVVKTAILSQPEVDSLDNGVLAAEFGLPDGRNRILDIVEFWTKNIQVKKTRTRISQSKIDAGFTISMIKSDYQDVLSLGESSVVTEKGQVLPWLEWLLLFGDRSIVRQYDVLMNTQKRSRSGLGIMVSSSRSWSVPPQFSGISDNNFVTRAMDSIDSDIEKIIYRQLKAKF